MRLPKHNVICIILFELPSQLFTRENAVSVITLYRRLISKPNFHAGPRRSGAPSDVVQGRRTAAGDREVRHRAHGQGPMHVDDHRRRGRGRRSVRVRSGQRLRQGDHVDGRRSDGQSQDCGSGTKAPRVRDRVSDET